MGKPLLNKYLKELLENCEDSADNGMRTLLLTIMYLTKGVCVGGEGGG